MLHVPPEVNRLEQARRECEGYLSLVNTSFAAAGLAPPEELYRELWESWRSDPNYVPSGSGSRSARRTVARAYSDEGDATDPDQVVLTAGSSVSYLLLLNVLRNHQRRGGDDRAGRGSPRTVLLPLPGYPLFEGILTALGLDALWYHCDPDTGFLPPVDEIDHLLHPRGAAPLALVLISPNNPAGITYPAALVQELVERCARAGTAVIIDEVFSLYRRDPAPHLSVYPALRTGDLPVFHLNGLSKLAAAPEIKAGWILISGGTDTLRREFIDRLDTAHDTYLTLSGPAEAAVRVFLGDPRAREARKHQRREINRRRDLVLAHLAAPWEARWVDSGIHIPVRLDPVAAAQVFRTLNDEAIAVSLLRRNGVLVHPGYLYGLDETQGYGTPWLILTALQDERILLQALDRLQGSRSAPPRS